MRYLFFLWLIQGFAAFNLTWKIPAVNLDSNPPVGDTDSNATIAIDPEGNAIASWSRTTGKSAIENIWVASYNHSQRVWTGAIEISGRGSAANPQLAMDIEGNAMIVWEEGFPTQIKYRILNKNGVWSPDLLTEPYSINPSINAQTFPQIAFDVSLNALVIWLEYFDGKEHVFSARKSPGFSWESLGKISQIETDASLIPSKSLAMSRSGFAIAAWEAFNGETLEIHGAKYSNGLWSEPLVISDQTDKLAQHPSVGIDDLGDAIIVWSQNDRICSKTISNELTINQSLIISDLNYRAIHPDVGVDKEGNSIVVYERLNSMHKFISAASLTKNANSWTQPVDISIPSPAKADTTGYPVLRVNQIGDGVAIWKELNGDNIIIQGAGYSLGTWSLPKTLSSTEDDSGAKTPAYDISVAVNDAGAILAIWPEDPAKLGTSQIKSTAGIGLANKGPTPPQADPETYEIGGVVWGEQIVHRFPAHTDLINVLSWTAPPGVFQFNIYRNNLSTLIGTTNDNSYKDHQRVPKEHVTYLITSLDLLGQESSPMTVVVHPE